MVRANGKKGEKYKIKQEGGEEVIKSYPLVNCRHRFLYNSLPTMKIRNLGFD